MKGETDVSPSQDTQAMGLAGLFCPNWHIFLHPLGFYKVEDWDKSFPQKVMLSELVRATL